MFYFQKESEQLKLKNEDLRRENAALMEQVKIPKALHYDMLNKRKNISIPGIRGTPL